MTERITTAALVLDVIKDGFDKGVEGAERRLRSLKGVLSDPKALKDWGRGTADAGRALTVGFTLPLIGAGASAVKIASDFESSFAGVRKTVDASEAELAQLAQGFRTLATTIPVNVNELNKIGEAAGQLGIKKEAILGFTRVMADLGVTTNLTSDEAATSLAQLANITQMSQDQFDRLGSTVVALGNAGASTERDIVQMGLRIAGAGKQVNLTEHQILGIASALSSVGIEAEMGGSAISKLLIDMAATVEKGGNKLKLLSAIAGVDFAKAFKTDAASALQLFIKGLSDTERTGISTLTALEALDIQEVRMRDTILRATGAGDLMNQMLDVGKKGWTDNNALTAEAEKRYATFESKATLLWNRVKDIAITFGNQLIPILLNVFEVLEPVVQWAGKGVEVFGRIPKPVQAIAFAFAAMLAAIGPLLFVVGQFAMGLAAVIPWIGKGTLVAKLFGVTIGAISWPIAAAVAALVAMIAVWKIWGDDIKRIVAATIGAVRDWFVNKFGPILRPVGELLSALGRMFGALGRLIGATLGIVVRDVADFVGRIVGWFRDVLGPAIYAPLERPLQIVASAFKNMYEGVTGWVSRTYTNVKTWLLDKFTAVVDWIREKVDMVTGFFERMYDKVVGHSYVPDMVAGIKQSFAGLDAGMVQPTLAATGQVTQAFKQQTEAQRLVNQMMGEGTKKKTEAQKAADKHAKTMRELFESMGGGEAIKKATDHLVILDKIGGTHKLTAEMQEKLLEVMAEALDSYKALGEQAPPEVRKVHDDLVKLVGLPKLIAAANADAATIVRDLTEQQRAREKQAFTETVDHHLQAYKIAREFADQNHLALMTETERAIELAKRQRAESIRAIEPIRHAFPEIYRSALAQIEAEFNASLPKQKATWGSFFGDIKQMLTGGKGIKGLLGNLANQIIPQLSGPIGEVAKIGNAAARAFAGDFSAATQLAQEYIGKFVNWAASKLNGLFGGPSQKEVEGRAAAKDFRAELAGLMNDRQKAEAGNDEWKKSVIVVRDAYLAVGRTEREALAAMDALWKAEKQGAGAVQAEMAKINTVLAQQKTLAEQTAKVEQDLRAKSDARMKELDGQLQDMLKQRESIAQAIAQEAPEEVMGVIETQMRAQMAVLDDQIAAQQEKMAQEAEDAAKALEEALAQVKPDAIIVPYTFQPTNSLPAGAFSVPTVPVTPMAEGGMGRVTRPTLFLAGEAGAEDFAFSGGGRRFGGAASNRPIHVHVQVNRREIGFAMVEPFAEAVGALT